MLGVEPTEICAGDSAVWTRTVLGYASSQGWTLTYYLQMAGNAVIPVVATADPDGSSYDVNVPGATTGGWAAGQYAWKAVITGTGANLGQRFTVDWAELVVRPDPTRTYDPRSHARKCYEAVTAVLEGRMGDPITRYKIGDTEAYKLAHMDLIKLQAFYASRVRTEAGRPLISAHQVVLK